MPDLNDLEKKLKDKKNQQKDTPDSDKKEKKLIKSEEQKLKDRIEMAKQLIKIAVKKKVQLLAISILTSMGPVIAMILVNIICFSLLAAILASILGALTGTMTDTSNTGYYGGMQSPGSKYIWNMQDYELITDDYLKNVYLHAWIISTIKEKTGSSIYTTTVLGIPIFEAGNDYYLVPGGGDNSSIAEYASGQTSTSGTGNRYQSIYQQYMWYDEQLIKDLIDKNLTKYGLSDKDLWGDIPVTFPLKKDKLDSTRISNINSYAGGDVMKSNYNIAAMVFCLVCNYSDTDVLKETGDRHYHVYGDAYKQALANYNLEDSENVHNYVRSAIYYMQHAGGFWNAFSDDDSGTASWRTAREAIMDYLIYCYVTYPDLAVGDVDPKNLNNPDFKHATMGDANSDFTKGVAFNKNATCNNMKLFSGGKKLSQPTVISWMKHNSSVGKESYTTSFTNLFDAGNSTWTQAMYAVSVGPTISPIGTARLNAVFENIGKPWVLDPQTGYVCNPASGGSSENGVTDVAGIGGDFAAGWQDNVLGSGKGGSNVRNPEWFVKLNPGEWAHPLNMSSSAETEGVTMTSRYGLRKLNGSLDWHTGVDLVYKNHTWAWSNDVKQLKEHCPVYAMHNAEITWVRNDLNSTTGRCLVFRVTYSRNGQQVTNYITYMHLSSIDQSILDQWSKNNKATVKKGQKVGTMGGSGTNEFQYGVHLHVQISKLPSPNGKRGVLDIETELPFFTQYTGYKTLKEGYMMRAPATNISGQSIDPQVSEYVKV